MFVSVKALLSAIVDYAGLFPPAKLDPAGLHHPLSARYPITADSKSPAAAMHGFLNVAIAAALAYLQRITAAEILALLQEAACDSFQFTETTICWRDRCLSLQDIQLVRNRFFRSFGSCSFQDPVYDLNALALLD